LRLIFPYRFLCVFKFLSLIAVFYVAYALLCVSAGKENRVGTLKNFFGGAFMKSLVVVFLLAGLMQGCQFLGGAATGALATGAGYEIQSKRQMDRLEDDFKSRRISREEYESRKRQIESGSIVY
jgi:hypothetical protein